jgi:hypothetical protein
MTTYLIGYDIHPAKGETYDELIKGIKGLSNIWWHHLDSTWVVVTDKTPVQIRDALRKHLKSDDQLLVVKSGRDSAWTGFNPQGSDWLHTNL